MAKIILKSPYLKPGAKKHASSLVRHVASRKLAELPDDSKQVLTATQFQKKTVEQLLYDYPDTADLYEYADYQANPTRANADEYILRVAEVHPELLGGRERYVDYIATRPGVVNVAEHGLFSDGGTPMVLEHVVDEVAGHTGNIWCHIISLRREDAERLGYENVEAWQGLLRSQRNVFAKSMKIHPNNFRWYAAFHNKDHHPHCHMVAYSSDPGEPRLSKKGIIEIKSSLAKQIFRSDLDQIYERQTGHRDALRLEGRVLAGEIIQQINSGDYNNPAVEDLLLKLADRLKDLSGKKVYGYLKPDVKAVVDRIVDELAKDERIAKLYDLWYEQKYESIRIYTDNLPEKVPLSQIEDFKPVKNAVIEEAMNILLDRLTFEEAIGESPVDPSAADEPSTTDEPDAPLLDDFDDEMEAIEYYADWNKAYKNARAYLYGSSSIEQNFNTAYALLLEEAEKGNAFALYDVGRMHKDGLGRDKDMDTAQEWFAKAYAALLVAEREWEDNSYLQYRLGKMNAQGFGVEQSYKAAAEWYEKAVAQGNPFAAYALAGLCYRGQGVAKNVNRAFELYMLAASHLERPNVFAMYELGRMYRDGVGTEADQSASADWFYQAYDGFVLLEEQTKDDKLQYRLGQMCLTGTGTIVNLQAAHDYFEDAAKLGNTDAMYGLGKLYLNKDFPGHDVQAAIRWLAAAVKDEHESARYTLGKLFLKGTGVQQDEPYAVRLLTQAAEQGNQWAQLLLGKTYLAGTDVPQNLPLAEAMLEAAANQDNTEAQYALAKMHLNGQAGNPSAVRAVELLEAAASHDHEWAQYTLGKLLMRGEMIPKDVTRAEQLLLAAAQPRPSRGGSDDMNPGNQYAQYLLGKLYLSEDGVPHNAAKAVIYLNESAEQGYQWAQYQLGKMLLYGKEVEQDIERGLALLTASVQQGNVYADKVIRNYNDYQNKRIRNYHDYQNRMHGNARMGAALGSLRLLGHLARILKNRLDEESRRNGGNGIIENKLRQQIEEKKQAHGLRMG